MPELPEVETVVRGLRKTIVGLTIREAKINNAPPTSIIVGDSFNGKTFETILKDRTIETINRRGKNILINLSGNLTLWAHLKMTGHFYWLDKLQSISKHDLVMFDFYSSNGSPKTRRCQAATMHLRFNDYRRFGRLRLYRTDELFQQKGLAELGPEPLEFPAEEFVALCRSCTRTIKPALLDQSFIAGIGNIYADESLHLSRIHPRRLTSSLSKHKLEKLHGNIRTILKKAVRLMGSSVDTFSGVNAKPGQYQKYLRVYGREGMACLSCRGRIVREKIGSRSAHFCRRCQRI